MNQGSSSGPNLPQVPSFNYQQAAADQFGQNVNAATASANMSNTNQVTPYGSLTYNQTGGSYINGQWVPQYTATQKYNPAYQTTLDTAADVGQGAMGAAQTEMNALPSSWYTWQPGSQAQYQGNAYNELMSRQNQQFDRQNQQLQTQLANQGVTAGSTAYNNAFIPLNQSRVDASNQAQLSASQLAGQNLQQDITAHNQPLQQIESLYGLGAGSVPSSLGFTNTNSYNVNPVDEGGYELANYQGQLAGYQAQVQAAEQAYQAQMQAAQGMEGGIFGLGGAGLGALGLAAGGGLFGGLTLPSITRTASIQSYP